MAGLIPQSFIDNLLARTDIIEVVSDRITLKKAGRNHQALCPFHKEKSPSFSVSQDKQFYYCFGCGASGNAVGFVMDYDHIGFPEAVELLARRAGLEVPREGGAKQKRERYDTLYQILEKSAEWYSGQLRSHSSAKIAQNYLRQRGLDGRIAKQFQIGYAPPGWDNLMETLGSTPERSQLLLDGGLVVENEERKSTYDRFRNRIIFPIRDLRGRTIAFGGRVLGDDKPKYLNSPETPVFHKGRELYGLYEARQANRSLEQILVVEGYMDVIALAQQGITCAAATLGTATTSDHLNQLFRHTSQVIFCFDGDNAGRQAAWRALENAIPGMDDGRQIRFLFLPQGEDPDSLVRKEGPDAFLFRLKDKSQALPFDDYFFRHFEQEIDTSTLDGKARLVHIVTPYIHKLPEGTFKSLMLKKLGDISDLGTEAVSSIIESKPEPQSPSISQQEHAATESYEEYSNRFNAGDTQPAYAQPWSQQPGRHKFKRQGQAVPVPGIRLKPAKRALRLLLAQPRLAEMIDPAKLDIASPDEDVRHLIALTESLRKTPADSTYGLLGSWFGTRLGERLNELQKIDMPISNAEHVIKQCFKQLSTDVQSKKDSLSAKERLLQATKKGKKGWLVDRQEQQQEANSTKD
ncbi:DNA primase [Sansalvadorimonas sp. 2012CJ34-2]|uniref:DNA primase n=1 Tax=Parendozoicomonas callyspongiae TaxID=2942213 RepID=A0ABT0PF07_9GAMM|nr:DNA primase [Sansalvadorimonas sp. 2012CJ34-2]MCL6269974.1 DNA primase [Sansalvadorimonas sp. 2012CJ34-2]